MRARRWTIGILMAAALGGALPAYAYDPQTYRVEIVPSTIPGIDQALKPSSELESLRKTAPVGPFGLIARAQGDIERLETVLQSFGYYQGSATILIDGHPLNDAGLGDELAERPKGSDARVRINVTLGPLYHLGSVEIDSDVPPEARAALGLVTGAPAVAADVLAGGARLLTAIENDGYAFAKVDPPVAYEVPAERVLNLSFHVELGPAVRIGAIQIEGLKRIRPSLVRGRLLLKTGERYNADKIEKARRDLLLLGVFSTVTVKVGTAPDSEGQVAVTFQMRERPRHAVALNAGFSSDLGGSGGVTWTDRNVLGNAEQLTLAASVINLGGGSAATGVGYDTSAKLVLPEVWHRDQSLQFSLGALKQDLQAYDQQEATTGVTLTRKLSSVWSASIGLTLTKEQVIQDAVTRNYTLFATPFNLQYNSTDLQSPLDDPRHGQRASLSVVPTRSLGRPNATFIISQTTIADYFDFHNLGLSDPGRSILAVRGIAGLAQGAGEFSLPPDQRFYAGGSGTIRGYRYQAVGPQYTVVSGSQLVDVNPIGGTSITSVNLEFRQRIGKDWGTAVFVDGGQVGTNPKLFTGAFRIGVGAGARYYTPIGPIRLDFGLPISRIPSDDRFEVYIGLGQAF